MSDLSQSLVPLYLLPPSIRDDRQKALVRVLSDTLAELDITSLIMSDPMTVDAKLLPYMIREFGAQDFIQSDYPEHVQRRILMNIWNLKSLGGYDAGVKLGLKLLGMTAVIEQWHEQIPMGAPNTHIVNFYVDELLYPDGEGHFDSRNIRAAAQMISVTKRQSQGTEMRAGVAANTSSFCGAFSSIQIVAQALAAIPPAPDLTIQNKYAVIPNTQVYAVAGG